MIRFLSFLLIVLICAGCLGRKQAVLPLPYIDNDQHRYERRFYVPFDTVLEASKKALDDMGWTVTATAHPAAYEAPWDLPVTNKQVLIFAHQDNRSLSVFKEYLRLNIYLREVENATDMEIRYASTVDLPVKDVRRFDNEAIVETIFQHIAELLAGK